MRQSRCLYFAVFSSSAFLSVDCSFGAGPSVMPRTCSEHDAVIIAMRRPTKICRVRNSSARLWSLRLDPHKPHGRMRRCHQDRLGIFRGLTRRNWRYGPLYHRFSGTSRNGSQGSARSIARHAAGHRIHGPNRAQPASWGNDRAIAMRVVPMENALSKTDPDEVCVRTACALVP